MVFPGPALKSHVVIRRHQGGDEIPALSHANIKASSDGLGWHGLWLEVGSNQGLNIDDVMVDGHYVAINMADTTIQFEIRNESDWTTVRLPPRTFWINPEGRPFSFRHSKYACWASCIIQGGFLDAVAGRHYELMPGCGVVDEVLLGILQALIAILHDRQKNSREIADELIHVFVRALATRHGQPAGELSAKGGIAPSQLKSLLSWLEERIEDSLTVDQMAARVGLSAAHFSREFKRSTGLSPWGYIVDLRLEAARKLLDAGESVKVAALRSGFSDQFHLSRLFKQRFGISPSVFAKSHSR